MLDLFYALLLILAAGFLGAIGLYGPSAELDKLWIEYV